MKKQPAHKDDMQAVINQALAYYRCNPGDKINRAFVEWAADVKREKGRLPTDAEFAAWAGVDGDEWTVESEWRA